MTRSLLGASGLVVPRGIARIAPRVPALLEQAALQRPASRWATGSIVTDPLPNQSAFAFSVIAACSFLISAGDNCGRSTLTVSLLSLAVSANGGL